MIMIELCLILGILTSKIITLWFIDIKFFANGNSQKPICFQMNYTLTLPIISRIIAIVTTRRWKSQPIHGNASLLQCARGIACKGNHPDVWPLALPMDILNKKLLPRCCTCNKICRPYVLMFNDEEWLGLEGRGTSSFDIYDTWEECVEEVYVCLVCECCC